MENVIMKVEIPEGSGCRECQFYAGEYNTCIMLQKYAGPSHFDFVLKHVECPVYTDKRIPGRMASALKALMYGPDMKCRVCNITKGGKHAADCEVSRLLEEFNEWTST